MGYCEKKKEKEKNKEKKHKHREEVIIIAEYIWKKKYVFWNILKIIIY